MIAILLADGFEEIEALTPFDILKRAGLDVKTVAINNKIAVGAHKIPVICDICAHELDPSSVSMLILPGGMPGTLNLDLSDFTDKIISAVTKNGGRIAAICAAPIILGKRGLLNGKKATGYPSFEGDLTGAEISPLPVVTDGNVTTAKGMGVALDFSLELVRIILGEKRVDEISASVMKA